MSLPRSLSAGLRWILELAAVFVGVPFAALSLNGGAPFLWIFGVWGVYLVVRGVSLRRHGALGPTLFTLGLVLVVLAAFEANRWRKDRKRPRFADSGIGTLVDQDETLGYAPLPNGSGRVRLVRGDDTIFDVTPHHGPDGTRVGPLPLEAEADAAVLCFGGSFMYGHGLEDEAALPYRLGSALQDRGIRVYNFAYSGWGPHQMLRGLETTWPEKIREPVRVAIYLCLPDHVRRVQGWSTWDRRGPRYRLDTEGGVEHVGRFDDDPGTSRSALADVLQRSHLFRHLKGRVRTTKVDPALLVALVEASAARVEELWPDARFHVLLWDRGSGWTAELGRQLDATGLPVHRISELAPGFFERADLRIPGDTHPSAAAMRDLAARVLEDVVEPALE